MSHSTTSYSGTDLRFTSLTVINYAVGGETVQTSDVGATSVDGVLMGIVPAGQNSLAVPLFPVFSLGKIMLFRFVSGSPVEIPATTNLNAVIPVIAHVLA